MKNLGQEENDFSFPQKLHKIRYLRDFRKLLKDGSLSFLPFGFIRSLENERGILRVAVSISKRFSRKSTRRNRLKRVIVEMLRRNKNSLKGLDIWVFVNCRISEDEVLRELQKFLEHMKTTETS
ncbi:MAG: ribonuclease P protein component [Brevinematia bacterium]